MFKTIKTKPEYILSGVILLIVVLWTFSGFIFSHNKHSVDVGYKLENLVPLVKTKSVSIQKKNIVINLHATIDASNIVDIKAESIGKTLSIVAKEGSTIKRGDIILIIDNERQKRALDKSIALFKQRKTEYETEEELVRKGYEPKVKLALALTNLKEAEYALKSSEVDLENTIVRSPMDGVVDKIPYSVGDVISDPNAVLTKVHALHDYTAHTFVSERQVLDVKIGAVAPIVLANNKLLEGSVSFVSNIADPDTKTYKVDLSFFSEEIVPLGMSAKVMLPLKVFDAYHVDNNSVFLDDYGVIGIKILDAKNVVSFIPVEILSEENNGFWVNPKLQIDDKIVLVTLGGNFVKDGDTVSLN